MFVCRSVLVQFFVMQRYLKFLVILVVTLQVEGTFLRGNLLNRLVKHANIVSDVVSFKLRLFQENIERKVERK